MLLNAIAYWSSISVAFLSVAHGLLEPRLGRLVLQLLAVSEVAQREPVVVVRPREARVQADRLLQVGEGLVQQGLHGLPQLQQVLGQPQVADAGDVPCVGVVRVQGDACSPAAICARYSLSTASRGAPWFSTYCASKSYANAFLVCPCDSGRVGRRGPRRRRPAPCPAWAPDRGRRTCPSPPAGSTPRRAPRRPRGRSGRRRRPARSGPPRPGSSRAASSLSPWSFASSARAMKTSPVELRRPRRARAGPSSAQLGALQRLVVAPVVEVDEAVEVVGRDGLRARGSARGARGPAPGTPCRAPPCASRSSPCRRSSARPRARGCTARRARARGRSRAPGRSRPSPRRARARRGPASHSSRARWPRPRA